MKTILPAKITTTEEANQFLADLHANNEFFHLDDDAEDIVNVQTGERLFTDEEAEKINRLMDQGFEICEMWDLPIVQTILDELREDDEKPTES